MAQIYSVDIVNRALQRVGATRVTKGALFTTSALYTENSKNAKEAAALYNSLRRAELNRNIWRFSVRRMVLRAVDQQAPTWDSTLTYGAGAPVTYNNVVYTSLQASNTNKEPDTQSAWWTLNGAANTTMGVTFPAWDDETAYSPGNIVVSQLSGADGDVILPTTPIWLSLLAADGQGDMNVGIQPGYDGNENFWTLYFGPTTATPFYSTDPAATYFPNELTYDETGTVWVSQGENQNLTRAAGNWLAITGATIVPVYVPWSAGTGPAYDISTNNVYVLPSGYLREAPQAPKYGSVSFLGFPANVPVNDWVFEGPYLVSSQASPILFRFAADVQDTTQFDPLFVEGLGARIAYELCETLTQSASKLQAIGGEYRYFMSEARAVNAIEQGSTQPALDDYIATRW